NASTACSAFSFGIPVSSARRLMISSLITFGLRYNCSLRRTLFVRAMIESGAHDCQAFLDQRSDCQLWRLKRAAGICVQLSLTGEQAMDNLDLYDDQRSSF